MKTFKFFDKQIVIILVFLLVPFGALMQELEQGVDGITLDDIKSVMNQLDIYHGGFLAVREEFFANQTEGNKARYHLAGVDWGVQLLDAELRYIDYIEPVLYENLLVKDSISANWLEQDRGSLADFDNQIKQTKTYINLRSVMNDYSELWRSTKKRINHMRFIKAVEPFVVVTKQARSIHDALETQQKAVFNQLEVAAVKPVDWTDWQDVFDTYSASLLKVEDIMSDIVGDIENPRDFTSFDTDDIEWMSVMELIDKLKTELQTLAILQESSIQEFESILNSTVVPLNQPIPKDNK